MRLATRPTREPPTGAALHIKGQASYTNLNVKQGSGAKGRKLFMPIRCALTGRTDGIELEKIVQRLGKEAIIKRLAGALS